MDLLPTVISLEEDCMSKIIIKAEPVDVETDNNQVYWHLTDHDYIDTKQNTRPKKPKKQVKITELKAIYNCTTCGYRTMSRDVLYKHICTNNPKYILHRNMTKKLPKGYEKCTKCNFSTTNKSNLVLHMGTHMQKRKEQIKPIQNKMDAVYICSKCNYVTKNPTSLKIHKHIHSRGTTYKCMECEFSGKDLKELIKHYNEVKDLRCNCGYATHMKCHMTTHLRSHTGEKPFCCGICSFSTGDRAGLHRHMKKKHIIQ